MTGLRNFIRLCLRGLFKPPKKCEREGGCIPAIGIGKNGCDNTRELGPISDLKCFQIQQHRKAYLLIIVQILAHAYILIFYIPLVGKSLSLDSGYSGPMFRNPGLFVFLRLHHYITGPIRDSLGILGMFAFSSPRRDFQFSRAKPGKIKSSNKYSSGGTSRRNRN